MSKTLLTALALSLSLLTGCTDEFPDLDTTISREARTAEYPDLLPRDRFLDASVSDDREIRLAGPSVLARAAALRRRAAALRGRDIYDGQDALKAL